LRKEGDSGSTGNVSKSGRNRIQWSCEGDREKGRRRKTRRRVERQEEKRRSNILHVLAMAPSMAVMDGMGIPFGIR
jgi:hypothetical protein